MDPLSRTPLAERVANSIKQLSSAAQDLNAVSSEMGQAIAAIDRVLQGLNLGVPTWTRITGGDEPPNGEGYWHCDLGYAKVSNRWGIALRDVSGYYSDPDGESCDSWLFNDAPRWLRIEGVSKIPDLIEELIKNTRETTEKIKSKTAEVGELVFVIAAAIGREKRAAKRISPGIPPPPPAVRVASQYAPAGPPPPDLGPLPSSLNEYSPAGPPGPLSLPESVAFIGGAKKPKGSR